MAVSNEYIQTICEKYAEYNEVPASAFADKSVKRGLRNADGTGVKAGVTRIGDVHGYKVDENGAAVLIDGKRIPEDGVLTYRGIDVTKIVEGCEAEERYGFEEVAYLLLFGVLPTKSELKMFTDMLGECRELPPGFTEDVIIKAPSTSIMTSLARSVLALYSYDMNAEDMSLPNLIRQSIELISRVPTIVAHAYQAKKHYIDKKSMYIHFPKVKMSGAENFLRTMRPSKRFTPTEARLLDLALILHAEHGGGNNSTFSVRVLSSTGTDTYSAIAAGVGSLKGPKHGGANLAVSGMFEDIKAGVNDWKDDDEVKRYLGRILDKEVYDHAGLIYGMGHAIYTKSDPRAVLLKKNARLLAEEKGMLDEYELLTAVERLTPQVFFEKRGDTKPLCANVDLYSGFVYSLMGIPSELFTPLFSISRITGWCAHRIEETMYGGRIMRPAYENIDLRREYKLLADR